MFKLFIFLFCFYIFEYILRVSFNVQSYNDYFPQNLEDVSTQTYMVIYIRWVFQISFLLKKTKPPKNQLIWLTHKSAEENVHHCPHCVSKCLIQRLTKYWIQNKFFIQCQYKSQLLLRYHTVFLFSLSQDFRFNELDHPTFALNLCLHAFRHYSSMINIIVIWSGATMFFILYMQTYRYTEAHGL